MQNFEFLVKNLVQTIKEIGQAVAKQRQELKLRQGLVAEKAGITQECLSRFERGRSPELGSRKLLAILAVLGMELKITPIRSFSPSPLPRSDEKLSEETGNED